eukprot:353375-Chlamydomonas_euryale.AAC.12
MLHHCTWSLQSCDAMLATRIAGAGSLMGVGLHRSGYPAAYRTFLSLSLSLFLLHTPMPAHADAGAGARNLLLSCACRRMRARACVPKVVHRCQGATIIGNAVLHIRKASHRPCFMSCCVGSRSAFKSTWCSAQLAACNRFCTSAAELAACLIFAHLISQNTHLPTLFKRLGPPWRCDAR